MRRWKLQDAKARFSEVVKEATNDGPQEITLRGAPAVIVISKAAYEKLVQPKLSFLEFMRRSPLINANISIERNPSLNREIDL